MYSFSRYHTVVQQSTLINKKKSYEGRAMRERERERGVHDGGGRGEKQGGTITEDGRGDWGKNREGKRRQGQVEIRRGGKNKEEGGMSNDTGGGIT